MTERCDVFRHSHMTVDSYTEVRDSRRQRNRGSPQMKVRNIDLSQLLTRPDPDSLCFVRIELQSIAGQPLTDTVDAYCELLSCDRSFTSRSTDVDLCIVGIRVRSETTVSYTH